MLRKRFRHLFVVSALVSIAALAGWQAFPHHKVATDRLYDEVGAKRYAMNGSQSASHLEELEPIKNTFSIPPDTNKDARALALASDAPAGPSRLQEIAQVKDDLGPGPAPLKGTSELEELARIKDDWMPSFSHFAGPSRLEELAQIKEQGAAVDTLPVGPSRLEILEGIKGVLAT